MKKATDIPPIRDKALSILSRSMHTEKALRLKLIRAGYPAPDIDATLAHLLRIDYLNDEKFARAKAASAADRRKRGQRNAYSELVRAGVAKDTAKTVTADVYSTRDSAQTARDLVARKTSSLTRLDRPTAKRRLTAMLLRRGFSMQDITSAVTPAITHLPLPPRTPWPPTKAAKSKNRFTK